MSSDLSSSFLHFKIPMSKDSKNGIYAFDHFKVDVDKLMLYRDDAELSLPPKVVRTLAVLVEHRGSILSKDELIERVWQDSIVEESNLSQHLYLLRKTLGNKPDGNPYIETFRRRGYRFTADVRSLPDTVVAAPTDAIMGTSSVDVVRQGNVLRLVDRKPAHEPEPKPIGPAAAVPGEGARKARTPAIAIAAYAAIFLVATLIGVFVFLRLGSSTRPAPQVNREISVVRLTNGGLPTDATLAPDGVNFVYHERDGDGLRMWLQQVGNPGRVEITSSTTLRFEAKTFSPDGRFVYFVASDKATDKPSLYSVAAMGGPTRKILDGVWGPISFSPDGTEFVFLRIDWGSGMLSLLIADKEGRGERILRLAETPKKITGPPSWSPDGSMIAFAEADVTGSNLQAAASLLAINLADGSIREFSREKWDTVYRIAWTHKGDGLVMIATRGSEGWSTRRDQVYFVSHPDGESRRVTSDGNRHQPWSLGITKDDSVLAIPFSRSSQIWSMALDAGNATDATQISTGAADGRAGLAHVPDGRVGYISRTGESLNAWIMNADGSGAKQLISDPPIVDELRADPQGRYLVFSAPNGKYSHLHRIDSDGAGLRQLTFGERNDVDSTISKDGNWLIYDSYVVVDRFRSELWKVSIDGGEPVRFSDEECSTPHFSPSGALVSCVRDEREILILSAADGRVVETYKIPENSTVNFGVGWTPDESGLTFIRTVDGFSNVWSLRRGAGPTVLEALTHFTSGYVTRFAYSHDGSRLFVARGHPVDDAILISNFR